MIRLLAACCAVLVFAISAVTLRAHEVRPAYLLVQESAPGAWDVTWKQPLLEGSRLKIAPDFRGDGACDWQPLSQENLGTSVVERGMLSCAIDSITIAGLERTLTDVIVDFRPLEGEKRTALLKPDARTLDLGAPPQSPAAAYLALGVEHILLGWDHLLFVIGLILLVPGRKRLIGVATAFTLAHSVTLGLAALGFVGVPSRPVEILIAASIVLLALEIIRIRQGKTSLVIERPYLVVLVIGLVHGLGFAGALSDIGLPQGTELLALLMFNLGVELGQIMVIAAMLAILALLLRFRPALHSPFQTSCAYVLGAIGTFWVIERSVQYLG